VEKARKGRYPVQLYLRDAGGKTVVAAISQEVDFTEDKTKYNTAFELPQNIPVQSFWPDDASPYKTSMRIGESEEKDIGTIGLYRKSQIVRDGIIVLPGFKIPFYVVLMAFLGATGYVFSSILKKPEFSWKNIRKWVFRLVIGPLFGIFLYSISTLINQSPDTYIIGALCFASGFYINAIQEKMRDFVFDKLAPGKKLEDDITELEADDSELIPRLSLSRRAAYFLKKEGIITVSDLSASSDEKLKSIASSSGIDADYLLKKKAEATRLEENSLSKLNLPLNLMTKLPKGIKYLTDFLTLDASGIKLSSEEQNTLNKARASAKTKIEIRE
jgi:hypothetical protein